MLPAVIVLAAGTAAFVVWLNKREAQSLADIAIRNAFRGKRELEMLADQLLSPKEDELVEGSSTTLEPAEEVAAPEAPITAMPEAPTTAAVWVNVDTSNMSYIIHRDEGCRYVREKSETALKGVGELKASGGWLPFSDTDAAQEAYPEGHPCSQVGCWSEAPAP